MSDLKLRGVNFIFQLFTHFFMNETFPAHAVALKRKMLKALITLDDGISDLLANGWCSSGGNERFIGGDSGLCSSESLTRKHRCE